MTSHKISKPVQECLSENAQSIDSFYVTWKLEIVKIRQEKGKYFREIENSCDETESIISTML